MHARPMSLCAGLTLKVYYAGRLSLRVVMKKQMRMNRRSSVVGYGFMRTVAHALFRVRPFVLCG